MTQGIAGLRVLIVDDNQHMRAIVGAILHSVGVSRIREAADGSDALRLLRDWPAEVAIIDYQMSPMDGLELTQRLRDPQTSPNRYLPIIMMTGFAERAKVVAARDAGVNEFLVKPLTAKAVLDRLHAAVFKPRPFVETKTYVGPTRRRFRAEDAHHPRRRAEDAAEATVEGAEAV